MFFSIFLIQDISIGLNKDEAIFELSFAILANHVLLKLIKLARGYVDPLHVILADGVLRSCCGCSSCVLLLLLFVIMVSILLYHLARCIRALLREWPIRHLWHCWGGTWLSSVIIIDLIYVVHIHLIEERWILAILGFVLIQFHRGHLLLKFVLLLCFLLGCFSLQLLLGLLFLFLLLDSSVFVKYILIMQNRVAKLVLEILLIQKLLDPLINNRILQDLINVRSFVGVFV